MTTPRHPGVALDDARSKVTTWDEKHKELRAALERLAAEKLSPADASMLLEVGTVGAASADERRSAEVLIDVGEAIVSSIERLSDAVRNLRETVGRIGATR